MKLPVTKSTHQDPPPERLETTMHLPSMIKSDRSPWIQRRGNVGGLIVLVTLFVVVSAVGVFLVIWDGQAGQAQIDADPPAGSVEGNLAQLANWTSGPIRGYINKNDKVPSNEEGNQLLTDRKNSPPPVFYPPAPVGDGNPTYRISNNGFELVFPGTEGKPVVCRFSDAGAYEGATGLGAFTSEQNSVEDPLKDVPR